MTNVQLQDQEHTEESLTLVLVSQEPIGEPPVLTCAPNVTLEAMSSTEFPVYLTIGTSDIPEGIIGLTKQQTSELIKNLQELLEVSE